jgi:type IV secretion system protein VirB8
MTPEKDAHFKAATDWAFSREKSLRSSSRLAWGIAIVASVVALAEGIGIAALAPLKTVTPIPVLVDRQTGFVETLKADGRAEIRADAALTQSLVAQYVIARESYNIASVGADYRRAMIWSAEDARSDYANLMDRHNSQSPLRIYARAATVEPTISSVSLLSPQVYLVRFTTTRHDAGRRPAPPHHWAAVLNYRFVDTPMKLEDRLTNPLGFQVLKYRKDEEGFSADPQPVVPASEDATVGSPQPNTTASAKP